MSQQYMHLIGAEDVQRAASQFAEAVNQLGRTSFGEDFMFRFERMVERMEVALSDHATRIEKAIEKGGAS